MMTVFHKCITFFIKVDGGLFYFIFLTTKYDRG